MPSNPNEFWGEAGSKIQYTPSSQSKYELLQIKTKDNRLFFEVVAEYLCRNMELFTPGYIDLDKVWLESKDPTIVKFRTDLKPKLEEKQFKAPFCGRRLYLAALEMDEIMVPLEEKEPTDPADEIWKNRTIRIDKKTQKVVRKAVMVEGKEIKTPGSLRWIGEGKNRAYMKANVCIFKNTELGYKPPTSQTEIMPNGERRVVQEEEIKFKNNVGCFTSALAYDKIMRLSELMQKAHVAKSKEEFVMFYAFLIAGPIKSKPASDDFPEGFNMTVDDALLI